MPYLIDGYNLLWWLRKSEEYEGINEVFLCKCVGQYFRSIGDRGEMIFDGIGPPDKSGLSSMRFLEISFSGKYSDADSDIERKIAANSAPKRLVIVSSDNRIRKAARSRKCGSLKSEHFWAEVEKQLSKKKLPPEPSQKREGLSDGEAEHWLDYFGFK